MQTVLYLIQYLYLRILETFQREHMPYFFIPEINVLNNIPIKLHKRIMLILKYVTMNIHRCILLNTKPVLEIMTKVELVIMM